MLSKKLAIWTIHYDDAGGSAVKTDVTVPTLYVLKNSGDPTWKQDVYDTQVGQAAIDDSYLIDPTPWPTLTGANATDAGLDWPCDWTQFSDPCPPVTPTTTPFQVGEITNALLICVLAVLLIDLVRRLFASPKN